MESISVRTLSQQNIPSKEDWDRHRSTIEVLYVDAEWELKKVIQFMKDKHGHHATPAMYKKRLRAWKVKKNYAAKEKDELLKYLEPGSSSAIEPTIHGRSVKVHRVRRHRNRRLKEEARVQIRARLESELAQTPFSAPSQLHGREHLLRLVMDDKAMAFLNEYQWQVRYLDDELRRHSRRVWDPYDSTTLYTVLSNGLQLVCIDELDEAKNKFVIVCSMASDMNEALNVSMLTLCCMVLGHPLWRNCMMFREETRKFLWRLVKEKHGDNKAIHDIFLALEDFTVTQQVAWLLSSPGMSTLTYVRTSDLFSRVLSQSKNFYIHTKQISIKYELPLMRDQLERDISIEVQNSVARKVDTNDISHRFSEWWPGPAGPANPNGMTSCNFELRRPDLSTSQSSAETNNLTKRQSPGLERDKDVVSPTSVSIQQDLRSTDDSESCSLNIQEPPRLTNGTQLASRCHKELISHSIMPGAPRYCFRKDLYYQHQACYKLTKAHDLQERSYKHRLCNLERLPFNRKFASEALAIEDESFVIEDECFAFTPSTSAFIGMSGSGNLNYEALMSAPTGSLFSTC